MQSNQRTTTHCGRFSLPAALAGMRRAAFVVALLLTLGAAPAAASDPAAAVAASTPTARDAATARVSAQVVDASGAPVQGAVVTTSAGGMGATDGRGVCTFDVALNSRVEATLYVTAAASVGGVNLVGHAALHSVHPGDEADAGVVTVRAEGECQPHWLPGFASAGTNGSVYALTVFDDGSGPALYAGGWFTFAGGAAANRIAKWDGTNWSPLGSGVSGSIFSTYVAALTVFDDGSGPALYAGGSFFSAGDVEAHHIAKWDGAGWSTLGSGVSQGHPNQPVYVAALTVFDDGGGPALYAGGSFFSAGGVAVNSIAKWDGAGWSPLDTGMDVFWGSVHALTVFDDGGGPALYAGGQFTTAGGIAASCIAKWDGTTWSPLGTGMGHNNIVLALTVFDDGGGPALYAGGSINFAGGVAASGIAKWDGAGWSPLGSGINGAMYALTVFDDGSGPALYAGGYFTGAGCVAANRIARWDGAGWSPLGSGMNDDGVHALTAFDDGSGPALFAGGGFTFAGGVASSRIAKWGGCDGTSNPPCPGDTNGDGVINFADFSIVLAAYGACDGQPNYNPAADFNANCCVDFGDFSTVLANYGASCP